MIRAISQRDTDQIVAIHKKFYDGEFSLEELDKFFCSFVVLDDDTGKVITAGGVRTLTELVIITDKEIPVVQRRRAMLDLLQAGCYMSKQAGYEQLHAFVQDEHWARHLTHHGFRPTVGKSLVIDV